MEKFLAVDGAGLAEEILVEDLDEAGVDFAVEDLLDDADGSFVGDAEAAEEAGGEAGLA